MLFMWENAAYHPLLTKFIKWYCLMYILQLFRRSALDNVVDNYGLFTQDLVSYLSTCSHQICFLIYTRISFFKHVIFLYSLLPFSKVR